MLEEIPKLLVLDEKKSKSVVKEIAKSQKRNSLVSGIAQVRQHDEDAAFRSVKNLLASHAADDSTGVSWPVMEELQDLYSLYLLKDGPEKQTLQVRLSRATPPMPRSSRSAEAAERRRFACAACARKPPRSVLYRCVRGCVCGVVVPLRGYGRPPLERLVR